MATSLAKNSWINLAKAGLDSLCSGAARVYQDLKIPINESSSGISSNVAPRWRNEKIERWDPELNQHVCKKDIVFFLLKPIINCKNVMWPTLLFLFVSFGKMIRATAILWKADAKKSVVEFLREPPVSK